MRGVDSCASLKERGFTALPLQTTSSYTVEELNLLFQLNMTDSDLIDQVTELFFFPAGSRYLWVHPDSPEIEPVWREPPPTPRAASQ